MLKPTWPEPGQDSWKRPCGAWPLVMVLLAAVCLCLPATLHAGSSSSGGTSFMPGQLGTRAERQQPAQETVAAAGKPAAAQVEYRPIQAGAAQTPAAQTPAAQTPAAQGSSQEFVTDPAEKAAQRARKFRLSMAGKEQPAAEKKASENGSGNGEDAAPEAQEAGSEELEETLNTSVAGAKAVVPNKPLKFEECVHLALNQSPYFVESAMEVQLKRIDETDSWYQLLPKFLISTGYVVTGPNDLDSSDRFSLSFSTGSYDPIAAGFSIQATKLVTEVAILAHMSSINKGLYNLGQMFLQLGHLQEQLVLQEELVAVAKHEKTYLSNLLETGGTNPLEVRIAEQQVEMAVLERERIEAKYDEVFEDIKIFLGLNVEDDLRLALDSSGDQVIGYFRPNEVTVADVKANSIALKIQKQRREIQEYKIKLAWAQYLPKLYFQTRTADPIDKDDADDGLYTSVGFTWTLWDWGERYRNVRRQRMTTKQDVVRENIEELDLSSDWRSALATKRRTLADLKVARAEVELAGLRKRQGEISYQAGSHPFPVYLEQIRQYFITRKAALNKELADDKAMFVLRYMSGDLFNSYINAKNF